MKILGVVNVPKVLDSLLVHFKSKSSLVRLRIACYVEVIIKRYDPELLLKSQKALEADFLLKGIED